MAEGKTAPLHMYRNIGITCRCTYPIYFFYTGNHKLVVTRFHMDWMFRNKNAELITSAATTFFMCCINLIDPGHVFKWK